MCPEMGFDSSVDGSLLTRETGKFYSLMGIDTRGIGSNTCLINRVKCCLRMARLIQGNGERG